MVSEGRSVQSFVHSDVTRSCCISIFTCVLFADQVNQEQVIISTARNDVNATFDERAGHCLCILDYLSLVVFVLLAHCFFEAHGFCGDHMHQWAALRFREDGEVELLVQVFIVVREDQATTRTTQVLCVVVVTTSAIPTGDGYTPAATRPAM